jgi:ubiquinone/menaquinone biosynthesis C-methylase UbiE
MQNNQEEIWNKIAPEWYEFKTEKKGKDNLEFVKKQKGKILDLGGGSGRYLVNKTDLKFYLVDFSQEMLNLAEKHAKELGIKKENIETKRAELWEIPYKNDFFDSVVCIASLHCVSEKQKRKKTLGEIYRVLKKKGKARIVVWNKESGRFKNKKKQDFVKWRDRGERFYYFYTLEELEKEILDTGLKIISKNSKFEGISYHSIVFIVEK